MTSEQGRNEKSTPLEPPPSPFDADDPDESNFSPLRSDDRKERREEALKRQQEHESPE